MPLTICYWWWDAWLDYRSFSGGSALQNMLANSFNAFLCLSPMVKNGDGGSSLANASMRSNAACVAACSGLIIWSSNWCGKNSTVSKIRSHCVVLTYMV